MNKIAWIVCICIFIFCTVFVVSLDSTDTSRRVRFTNQNFEFKNEGNEIVNDTTNVHKVNLGGSRITNQNFEATNSDMHITDSDTRLSSQNTDFDNQRYNYDDRPVSIDHHNLDDSELDATLGDVENQNFTKQNVPVYGEYNPKYEKRKIMPPANYEYEYRNIDWSKWKSNFVNKILDDSLQIKELDRYPDGSMFYYSFIVDDRGKISNISVRSVHLSATDKKIVANFIQSYEYSYLTKFPENTKRKTARVSAIMMLSSAGTKHSKPSDFSDIEKIKYQVNN